MLALGGGPAAARAAVAEYYTRKLHLHGATPAGADWASAMGQDLRFALLLRLCDFSEPFSLNDVGCGYGALLDYLQRHHPGLGPESGPGSGIDYLGVDISAAMVACAVRRWRDRAGTRFVEGSKAPRVADYAIASGIFNVVPPAAAAGWTEVVAGTLSEMYATVRRGFAANFMRAAPGVSEQPGLYRTQPGPWVAYCEGTMDAAVTLVETHALGEFTLLVRRNRTVASPGQEQGRHAPAPAAARIAGRPSP